MDKPDDVTAGQSHAGGGTEARVQPAEGQVVGRYRIEQRLGGGGMGVVFRAVDTQLGRAVALKFISPALAGDAQVMARFLREARAASALDHPNVIAVFEVGEHGGLPFIAMALHEGESLKQRLTRGTIAPDECALILSQIADALAAAHASHIVHRDVKPGNVMLTPEGQVKLVDFGVAKLLSDVDLTRSGELVGTLQYMAPEQHQSREIGPAADLWAAGVVGYEMLAGAPPFRATSTASLVDAVLNDDPAPLKQSPELETILLKCLAKEPERRYPSAQALSDDLRRFLAGETLSVRRSTLGDRIRRRARRNRPVLLAALAGLTGMLLLGGWLIQSRLSATGRARRAQELGQRVQKICSQMRAAHLLPLHDIKRERDQVRAEMDEIGRQMAALGREGVGPGEYALGVGHFSLGEEAEAKQHLLAAWAAGEREPELAYALGLTLGTEYQRAVQNPPPLDEAGQKAHERDLKERLHDPALAYLEEAKGTPDTSPTYVEALIAYYDHRFDDALAKAKAAFAETPSLYEAGLLEAQILSSGSTQRWRSGKGDEARALWSQADARYEQVAQIARSDDEIHKLWADALRAQAFQRGRTGENTLPVLEQALAHCELGQRAYSEAWWPDALRGDVERGIAASDYRARRDPRPHLLKAIAAGERAVKLHPERWQGFRSLGDSWGDLADFSDTPNGIDPRPSLRRSVEGYDAALRVYSDPTLFTNSGITRASIARWEIEHGQDPTQDVEAALQAYEAGLRIEAKVLQGSEEASDACDLLGDAALDRWRRGQDPRPLFDRAGDLCKKGRELDKGHPLPLAYSAHLEWVRALYAESSGGDPLPALERAIQLGDEATKLPGADATAWGKLSRPLITRAELALKKGEDAKPWLERATKAAQRAVDLDGEADSWVQLGSASLVEARLRLAAHQDAKKPLATALHAVDAALAKRKEDLNALLLGAELGVVANQPSDGRGFLARALKVNPTSARALRLQSDLEKLSH